MLKQQKYLFLMMLPGLIWAIVFAYTPMVGLYMSFVNYQPTLGGFWSTLFTSEFVGLEWFRYFFNNGDFWIVMRNTLASTLITLLFSFPMPILIAIAINEIKNVKFKKTVQTASYLPYFISWVIAANIIVTLLSSDGAINGILKFLHITDESVLFLQNGKYFWWIVALGNTWKDMGYSSIMYLAAISSINQELYEAAKVDGANRFKQIRYITLPHLKPTIVILLILALGGILNAGFDQHFLLGNDLTRDYSDVLSTYSFRYGIQNGMFSYAAAVGMFSSVVAFIIVVIVNYTAKRLNGQSLF
jgi:putative aldouronate transport system permease protein